MSRIAVGFGVVLLGAVAAIILVLTNPDWLRGTAERIASSRLHRKVSIEGSLKIRWGGTPEVQIGHLVIANAAWDRKHPLLDVRHVDFRVRLWPLLRGHVELPLLAMDQPRILLERNPAGDANWVFHRRSHAHHKGAPVALGVLRITDGRLMFLQPKAHTELRLVAHTETKAARLVFSGKGRFRGAPLEFQGSGGSVLALASHRQPYPLALSARIGSSSGAAHGTLTNPASFADMDLYVQLQGASLSDLYPVFGIPLPKTAKYALKGRLQRSGPRWRLSRFSGQVGNSDLEGHLDITTGGRLTVVGRLGSRRLDVKDLAGFTGRKPVVRKPGRETTKSAGDHGRLLSHAPYHGGQLQTANLDLYYHAASFRSKRLPLDHLATHIRLHNGVLVFDPLDFGIADGLVASKVDVQPGAPLRLTVEATLKGIRLTKLLPKFKFPQANTGRLGGKVSIRTSGTSFAAFAGHANGDLGIAMGGGSISDLMVALAQLHLGNAFVDWMSGEKKEPIHCAVARFDIKNGVLDTRTFVIDTSGANIFGSGTVDFQHERLNLVLTTKPKHMAILSARGPLKITGTFKKPAFGVGKKKLIERGAAAVALGIINPAAALLSLVDTAPGHHLNCHALLNKAGPEAKTQALKSLHTHEHGGKPR